MTSIRIIYYIHGMSLPAKRRWCWLWSCLLIWCRGVLPLPGQTGATNTVFTLGEVRVLAPGSEPTAFVPVRLMQAIGVQDITEVLDLVPGIQISTIGRRNEATLFLRGFPVRHVPVLVDGIPLVAPYDGSLDLSRYPTGALSGIQVLRPGAGAIPVPNAFAGAVNLVTRRPGDPLELDGSLLGVADRSLQGNSWRAVSRVATRQRHWYLQASAQGGAAAGYRVSDSFLPLGGEDGGRRENATREQLDLSLRAGWLPLPGQEHVLVVEKTVAARGIPPYAGTNDKVRYWKVPGWERERIALYSRLGSDLLQLQARLWYDGFRDTLQSFDGPAYTTATNPSSFTSYYNDNSMGLLLQAHLRTPAGMQGGAFLYVDQRTHREHNAGEAERTFRDLTGKATLSGRLPLWPGWELGADLAWTANRPLQADHYTNDQILSFPRSDSQALDGRLSLGWRPWRQWQVWIAAARSSRIASMKERYSYRLGRGIPNPHLLPERAWTLEGGLAARPLSGLRTSLVVFHTAAEDYIQEVSVSSNLSQNRNVGQAAFPGLELALHWNTPGKKIRVQAAYTWLHPKLNNANMELIGIAEHSVRLLLRWRPLSLFDLWGSFKAVSAIVNNSSGTRQAGDFRLLDAGINLHLPWGLRLGLRVANLLDTLAATDESYPGPGRSYGLHLAWHFPYLQ